MSEKDSLHGLSCPNCGGIVQIPEGVAIVKCPYCELRSFVRGERGLRRYQVTQRTERNQAIAAMKVFLSGKMAIARNAAREATLEECFMVYLPFWTIWARVAGWAFGEKKVGSGDSARYESREIRIVQEMNWNGAACDVGEFGVTEVPVVEQDLHPFDPGYLHDSGLVFEPVGSYSDALSTAEDRFQNLVKKKANLDRLGQLFVRTLKRRSALVYHPLWVLRYLYRKRSFQIVVDGHSGKVLYGKAPGNTIYRAAVLVLGMAVGAFLAIDGPALLISLTNNSDDSSGTFAFALALLAAGIGIMLAAYRSFRYGEQYEYRSASPPKAFSLDKPLEMVTQVKDVEEWISRLN